MRRLLAVVWILVLAAVVGAIAAAATPLAPSDRQFIDTALQINTDEVLIAQAYAGSTDHYVRNFAQTLHTDSSESNQQLIAIADDHGVPVSRAQGPGVPFEATAPPSKLTPLGKAQQLQQIPPEQFFQRERSVDEKAIALYQREAATSRDAQLQSYAEHTLPVLRRHLDEATKDAQAERNH